jgi:hypothetical protein
MLPAFGVATGVDEDCGLNTLMGMGKKGDSRCRSGAGLTLNIVSSSGMGFALLYCSTKPVHAVKMS